MRSVLAEAGLDELLNEALLLTTELSTNAVVHAGTELDIEVVADPAGLTVTVTDFAAGPIETRGRPPGRRLCRTSPQVSERGRGLLLVDHFAPAGGRSTTPTGKGVWFRLDRPGAAPAPVPPDRPTTPAAAIAVAAGGPVPSAGEMAALSQIVPDPYADDALPDFAAHLLSRVAEMVGAAGGVVRLDRGDGAGPQRAGPVRPLAPPRRRPAARAAGGQPAVLGRAGAGRRALGVRPAARRARRRAARRCTWRTTGCAGPTCAGRAG